MTGTILIEGHTQRNVVTTEHPASSYGLPVVIVDGRPYGPADLDAALTCIEIDHPDDPAPEFHFRTVIWPDDPYHQWAQRIEARRQALIVALRAAGYTVS